VPKSTKIKKRQNRAETSPKNTKDWRADTGEEKASRQARSQQKTKNIIAQKENKYT
jgi:hypothetical protein